MSSAASVTRWVTGRVPSSASSSNSSSNAGMNALYINKAYPRRRGDRWSSPGVSSTIVLVNAGFAHVVDTQAVERRAWARPAEFKGPQRANRSPPTGTQRTHQRVDHGDAVVVDDRARVADARLAAGLDPREEKP